MQTARDSVAGNPGLWIGIGVGEKGGPIDTPPLLVVYVTDATRRCLGLLFDNEDFLAILDVMSELHPDGLCCGRE